MKFTIPKGTTIIIDGHPVTLNEDVWAIFFSNIPVPQSTPLCGFAVGERTITCHKPIGHAGRHEANINRRLSYYDALAMRWVTP